MEISKCKDCFHTDLPAMFSKFTNNIGPRSIYLSRSRTHVLDTDTQYKLTDHLNCESNKSLCHCVWANPTTDKLIGPGIYTNAGVLLTGDDLKMGAISCALRGLAVLAAKRKLLIHGSFVCHEYLRLKGVNPPFDFDDIDVLVLNNGSNAFTKKIYKYMYEANARLSFELDVVRTRANTWKQIVDGCDMNIGSIFLEWHNSDVDAPPDALGKYSDNWWFIGCRETASALLMLRGEYYRSDDDLSTYGQRSRLRKEKYIQRGFTFVDKPRPINDSHLDLYYGQH